MDLEYDECVNSCSGNGVCRKTQINSDISFDCQCDRDYHSSFYGVDCSYKSPYTKVVEVDKTITSPDGKFVIPFNGEKDTALELVTFHGSSNEGEEETVQAYVLVDASNLGLLRVKAPSEHHESIFIHLYDSTALIPSSNPQLINSPVSVGEESFSILGPLLIKGGDYVSIGKEDSFEIRRVSVVVKSDVNPSLTTFAVDEPFVYGHALGEAVTIMTVTSILPLPLPLVSPPPCESDCNASVGGGKCVVNEAQGTASCACNPGFNGVSCGVIGCKDNCKDEEHGQCLLDSATNSWSCVCDFGFTGDDCSRSNICDPLGIPCIHGTCRNGLCECEDRWSGDDCSLPLCPNNCNFPNGKCVSTRNSEGVTSASCECLPGYSGGECSQLDTCPNNCSGHGSCDLPALQLGYRDKVCVCDEGYAGRACQNEVPCLNDCSNNGKCEAGKCQCNVNWKGAICDQPVKCINDCNKVGECVGGVCHCKEGYLGIDCGVKLACEHECHGNGACSAGKCFCDPGFEGEFCETKIECQFCVRGFCHRGSCVCDMGWKGEFCDEDKRLDCPVNSEGLVCSEVGVCDNQKCLCPSGYQGKACEINLNCKIDCGTHGICIEGACICDPGWRYILKELTFYQCRVLMLIHLFIPIDRYVGALIAAINWNVPSQRD